MALNTQHSTETTKIPKYNGVSWYDNKERIVLKNMTTTVYIVD